ncbi:MAG: M28 family peptidase [Polyangiaceae bacterium]|nr:M28 family peptidase [Polyangiaceae bacterium]
MASLAGVAPGCRGGGEGLDEAIGAGEEQQAATEFGRPAPVANVQSASETRMLRTLNDLASFGEKRAGTTGGKKAGDYVKWRFHQANLCDVRFEEFSLNAFNVTSSTLTLTASANGQSRPLAVAGHQVFAYSGVGALENVEVVDVGVGKATSYVSSVQGKVVLVRAAQDFHRSNQLALALEQGAVGMISVSFAPSNLVQVGGVSPAELGLGPAPAVSIGGADGKAISDAIVAGETVRATLRVDATLSTQKGRNVVGRLSSSHSQPGDPYILVGAHYDTWSTGATDNGTGIASMLEIASTLSRWPSRNYDVVFVGYDAEELGLLGGYDYLRRHVVRDGDSIVAFVNLEMTGMAKAEFQGNLVPRFFVYSQGSPLAEVAGEANLASVYPQLLGLENVAPIVGGNIPTDVQGLYWSGIDGSIAFGGSPFYHTVADTPSTIDTAFLANNTVVLRNFLDHLDQEPAVSFQPKDPTLLYPEVTLNTDNPSTTRVEVTVRDANGQLVASPWARVQIYVDDFVTPQPVGITASSGVQELTGGVDGKVSFDISSAVLRSGSGGRWVHVRVGTEPNRVPRIPRGERVLEVY